jgi:hypothetical protein
VRIGRIAILILVAILGSGGAIRGEEGERRASTDKAKWRFEFDNDVLSRSDDAYTAGWSLQRHSPHFDLWAENRGDKPRGGLSRWIGENVPGLNDGGPGRRVVRRAMGLTQIIQTPAAIDDPDPQPEDVPWAGVLGFASSWSSYDNDRFGALQLFVGCMGPCSGAEQVQRFVHLDLGIGDLPPLGWENQLDDELLVNLNYALRYKLAAPAPDRYRSGRFAGDLSIGGQAALGNYYTFGEVQVELRFGWGLPLGFTHTADPAGRGIMLDPEYVVPGGDPSPTTPRFYVSATPRITYFEKFRLLEGGTTQNGGFHPGIDYDTAVLELLYGFHLAYRDFAVHMTYYHFPDDPIDVSTRTSFDWVNLSFEWRF